MHIITEINGPGHARAAIKSMEKRGEEQFILYDKLRFQIYNVETLMVKLISARFKKLHFRKRSKGSK